MGGGCNDGNNDNNKDKYNKDSDDDNGNDNNNNDNDDDNNEKDDNNDNNNNDDNATMVSSSKLNDDSIGGGSASSLFACRSRDGAVVTSQWTSPAVLQCMATLGAGGLVNNAHRIFCLHPAIAIADVDVVDKCRNDNFDDTPSSSVMMIPSYLGIPLRYHPSPSAYTVPYWMGTLTFGTIINAGSPFSLVLAPPESGTYCPDFEWGCLHPTDGSAMSNGLRPAT
jgi:hypothetical protein